MRIVFMGTPQFARHILQTLLNARFQVAGVVSQPDRPAGRGRRLRPPPVAALAQERSLPLIQPEKPGQPETLRTLSAWRPQVIVVAAYGAILPPAVLQLPPLGCLNVHASLLPRHRGASPIQHAILASDEQTGVTIMLMDEGLDTGPILAQRAIPIEDSDTAGTLEAKLAQLGGELLTQTLPAWGRGEITPQPQDERGATYAPLLCKADGRIDWTRPAAEIERQVRAFDPWPGAHTFWNGTLLKILEAALADRPPAGGRPGQVLEVNRMPAVATGDGALILKRVQLAGRRPMDGQAFLLGQPHLVGSILGE